MARTEARIKCAIWDDEDFRQLTVEAQWLYHAILEQKDLSLCGVLTWTPRRFAKLASNASARATDKALDLLRERRYVLLDEDTDELLVRTFITGDRVLDNPNSILGMSNSFGAIHSLTLRAAVVDRLGQGFIEGLPDLFPKGLPKGFHDRLGKAFVQALALTCTRPPPGAPVPPASGFPPPASPADEHSSSSNLDPVGDEPAEEEEPLSRIDQACALVAQRRLDRRLTKPELEPITDRPAWLARAAERERQRIAADPALVEELGLLADAGEGLELLADRIDPPERPAPSPYTEIGNQPAPAFEEVQTETGEWVTVRVGA